MLQINDHLHQDEIKLFSNNQLLISSMPTKGCLGMVLATGFDTSKGKLIRRVVANAENLKL
jgi:cation-transporting ATPase 13A1